MAWPTPAARATLLAENSLPLGACPSGPWYVRRPAHPHFISRARAIKIASPDKVSEWVGDPRKGYWMARLRDVGVRRSVHAALLTPPGYRALGRSIDFVLDCPRQRIWVITVHGDFAVNAQEPLHPLPAVEISHVYTIAEDAQTGEIRDSCYDCALLG